MSATAILPPSSALLPAPVVQLHDETFDPAHLGAYHLDILLTEGHCRLAVREAARQKVVVLEDWTLAAPADLPALAAGHELLGRPGWAAVRLAVGGGAFTLLPAPLFRAGDEAAYLQLHHPLSATEQAWAYALPPGSPAHELVSLFAVEAAVAEWLHATHGPGARLLHHTSALVAGLLHQRGPAAPTRQLYLHLAGPELTLVVLGAQLEFCNVFAISTPEDAVYYTILVMQELGLNPDQDAVAVWGDLTSESAIFTLLRTYVRHLRFGSRPFGLQYSYRLNELAECRHFELFSLAFCA
ncbi:DUF3822 family protein [Hymenobacter bucti]|uniref:DUF3822 family protein n=1 Tax=Hymenobacter bucti TaxID=1844114 RepID=A0ABW4QUQ2_9BACT